MEMVLSGLKLKQVAKVKKITATENLFWEIL